MRRSTKNQAIGSLYEAKGRTKETTGKLFNNPELEIDGKAEKAGGKLQKKIGQIEKSARE